MGNQAGWNFEFSFPTLQKTLFLFRQDKSRGLGVTKSMIVFFELCPILCWDTCWFLRELFKIGLFAMVAAKIQQRIQYRKDPIFFLRLLNRMKIPSILHDCRTHP